jgi:hypothetical protein
MHGISADKESKPKTGERDLKPAQVAPDQDGAIVCQRFDVVSEIRNSASATGDGEVVKSGASVKMNEKAASLNPQTKIGFLVQGCPHSKGFVESSDSPQDRTTNGKVAPCYMLDETLVGCAKATNRGRRPPAELPGRRSVFP